MRSWRRRPRRSAIRTWAEASRAGSSRSTSTRSAFWRWRAPRWARRSVACSVTKQVWNEGERYPLEIEGSHARITFTPFGPARPAHGQVAEMFAFDVLVNAGRMGGDSIRAIVARFRHAPEGDALEKARLLGSPMEFGAPLTELLLPAEALSRPLPHANEALADFLERHVGELAARLPGAPRSVPDRVRALIGEHLREGADPAALAAPLHMSPRTLQRRLREEGTSLAALVDEARRSRATALLRAGLAIGELAYLLGYSEPSAFHRTFRRWTGRTPER